MHDVYSLAPFPANNLSLSLHSIWDVDKGNRYDVKRNTPNDSSLVLIRTLAGSGRIYLRDSDETYEVSSNTILLIRLSHLQRYHTVGKRWYFWWFVFTTQGTVPIPFNQILSIAPSREDRTDFKNVFQSLRSNLGSERRMASARLVVMIERWITHWTDTTGRSADERALQNLINAMYDKLSDNWTVHKMAEAAHMSERRFRQNFSKFTGHSPKTFYDNLRLTLAQEILKQGRGNVSEVADSLGYSSPFHFSKAFRKHFGYPPSRMSNQTDNLGE